MRSVSTDGASYARAKNLRQRQSCGPDEGHNNKASAMTELYRDAAKEGASAMEEVIKESKKIIVVLAGKKYD